MREIIIGNFRTISDWGCYTQEGWVLTAPEPKTKYIDIPGADGKLDLTSVLTGIVNYGDREFKATLFSPSYKSKEEWEYLKAKITNAIHGQKLRLILPDSPDHFLNARMFVEDFDITSPRPTLDISATCDPWRYKSTPTSVKSTINGTKTVPLENERKPALITIDTNVALTVKFDKKTVPVPVGKTEILDFVLNQGTNNLSITGTNATVTITYQEASL